MDKDISDYTTTTRWLHFFVAIGAVYQLTTSLVLLPPDEQGSAFGRTMLEAHELGGLVVAAFVALHLLSSFTKRRDQSSSLWVLFDYKRWGEAFSIVQSLPYALSARGTMPGPGNSLARIIEMLGLLVIAAMAVSGLFLWFWLPENSLTMPANADLMLNIHSLISNLLWAYIAGHALMAWAHKYSGDDVVGRISPLCGNAKKTAIKER